jgi:SAM-dependent methyltransferase
MRPVGDPPSEELSLPQYDSAKYWDRRYADDPEAFEWYQGWRELRPLLDHALSRGPAPAAARSGGGDDADDADGGDAGADHDAPPASTASILQLGVGTSELAADLVERGGHRGPVFNVDISPVCVEHMRALHARLAPRGVTYELGDACDMRPLAPGPRHGGGGGGGGGGAPKADRFTAADASFDVVIDKGTADALMCGSGAEETVRALVAEAARVLRPGGAFLLVSYGAPDRRLGHLLPDGYTPSERGSDGGSDGEEEEEGDKGSGGGGDDRGGEGDEDDDEEEEEEEEGPSGPPAAGPYPGGRRLPWRPRDVAVYVIAKAGRRGEVEALVGRPPLRVEPLVVAVAARRRRREEEEDAQEEEEEGGGGSEEGRGGRGDGGDDDDDGDDEDNAPVIFGPLCPTDDALMERVSQLNGTHFAYLCRRPAADESLTRGDNGGGDRVE